MLEGAVGSGMRGEAGSLLRGAVDSDDVPAGLIGRLRSLHQSAPIPSRWRHP